MRIVAPLAELAGLLPREAPAVLGLILVTKDRDALGNVQLIVRLALCFTMGQWATLALFAHAFLVLCAENVRLDLNVGSRLVRLVVVAIVLAHIVVGIEWHGIVLRG